jgi:hypothetical protein
VQPSLVALLLACVALAALGFFLGFVRRVRPFGWLPQATFVFMAALMVPLLVILLGWQAGAAERLARTGVVPHPDARHAIGLAVGRGDASPQWLFALDDAAGTGLGYYELPEHRDGWEIVSRSDGMWILERGERRMVVTLAASGAGRSIGYAAVR